MTSTFRFVLLTLVLSLAAERALAQAGQSGLSFLKLGISARGVSMGDAMSALADGAAATYYNPAGLTSGPAQGRRAQLLLMHKEWAQDTRTEFLGAMVPLDERNSMGFSLNSTTVSEIEIRTRPGPSEGTFTARDFSFGASYSHLLTDELRVGATGKFLYEKILVDEASGLAFDFGAQLATPVEHLTVGAVVANLGGMKRLRNTGTTLPSLLRLGAAYSTPIDMMSSEISMASDFVHVFPEKKSYLYAGAEIVFDGTVAARTGYQFGSAGRGFSAGVGLYYDFLSFDYAFAPLSSDLGSTHTFSIALNL